MLAGDRELYGLLFARYRQTVVNFAASRIRDRSDAESVAQDVFIRAFRSLGQLTSPDRFSSWLLQITANVCRNWLAKRARTPRPVDMTGEDHAPAAAGETPTQEAERRELGRRIHAALADLPEPFRTTASLRYLGGKSCAEIAEIQGLGIGTVTMRLSRANKRLRQLLEEEDEAET